MAEVSINILIVEDDPIIAEDLHSLLTNHDYKVIGVVHNGTAALDALMNKKPDFAILDIHLGGGMTGVDVAEVIHNKHKIPFIFLTSFDDEATLEVAQQHGPYGYLVKPFQDRSLLTTIKIAMTNYQAGKEKNNLDKDRIESIIKQSLTDQEHTIICDLLEGLSYKQIALKQHISANTVKYHTGNIYNKCDIKGRSELSSRLFDNS